MLIDDLIPAEVLGDALDRGLVRRQTHPELPLAILNYTERAAYEGVWNEATLACRGLILHEETGAVVARPFPKFFNYGQPGAPELDLDAPALVTEKVDGSLGILYPVGGGRWAVATRGSFASAQALHATAVWAERYEDVWRGPSVGPLEGFTYLFEIVYPENRIVCDYGDLDDLILLGVVENETGLPASPRFWPGPRVPEHPYRSLAEALAAPPRPNAEGLVVYLWHADERVKLKQEDYVALHRIVTGLNKRAVWAHLDAGLPIDELIAPLPDEFRPWVEDVVAELSALVAAQAREIEHEFISLTIEVGNEHRCPECAGSLAWVTDRSKDEPVARFACTTYGCERQWEAVELRKAFALRAKESPWSWALFLRLDGKDYASKLWHLARPDPVSPAGRVLAGDAA